MPSTPDLSRDVVLTSFGRGSFLVRRKKQPPVNQCPLLGYEVSRIDAGDRPDAEPVSSAAPPAPRTACRNLLILFMAGLIQI